MNRRYVLALEYSVDMTPAEVRKALGRAAKNDTVLVRGQRGRIALEYDAMAGAADEAIQRALVHVRTALPAASLVSLVYVDLSA